MKSLLSSKYATPDRIVSTGEVTIAGPENILISSPLGSCIAICAYEPASRLGGIAHVMLPGYPPEKTVLDKDRYAGHALTTLTEKMEGSGVNTKQIQLCLVGGANVLKREQDTIHLENLKSIICLVATMGIPISRCCTGGYERMIARLDTGTGLLYRTIGNTSERLLFDFNVLALKTHSS